MDLSRFPRLALAHLPTPLEPLKALSRHLGGPDIYVKRDDCTGLAGGGNKTRKLEFLMADAVERHADTIVTVGATQSNHIRQTVAAAAKLGLRSHVLVERGVMADAEFAANGNMLLDTLMGATVHPCEPGGDLNAQGRALADDLASESTKPYFIPAGASNALGALGYVECAVETLQQADNMRLAADALIVASGSQGTQAGLLVGLAAAASDMAVHGICVSRSATEQEGLVFELARQTAELAAVTTPLRRNHVICDDGYYAPGYSHPNDDMIEAVLLCARLEALLLDPVYSGKAMAGLIGKIRNGDFEAGNSVIFLHTGGQAALHAYRRTFEGR